MIRLAVAAVVVVTVWAAVNWMYQVMRKPTELYFPVSGRLAKAPAETWRRYGPLFAQHSTTVITPELLAALAQVEGAGNPVARTYWRWRLTWNPFEVYRPASSAVGMYQITDATFREAKRYCVHNHVTVEAGPWNDVHSCWFNGLYTRVVPSHAVEMTAAMLDRASEVFGSRWRARVEASIVSRELNVRQVLSKVLLGEADAAVVYDSDLVAASEKLDAVRIPDEANVIAEYPIAVVRPAREEALAQAFVRLVLSSEGRAALTRAGFLPPPSL